MSEDNITVLDSSKSLLDRFNREMLACHRPMEILKIVFKDLEGSWLAIPYS